MKIHTRLGLRALISTFVVLALILPLHSCNTGGNYAAGPNYALAVIDLPSFLTNPLSGIERRIEKAFTQSIVGETEAPLLSIEKELTDLYDRRPVNLVAYWLAYTKYYHAILSGQLKDEKGSEQTINEGIEILEDLDEKNSEDYALLALLKSYSIQFKKGLKAAFVSGKVSDYGELAVELNPNNLRAHFVLASSDYYTPEKYGGGKKAEALLIKTIELPEQETPNDMLPAWGKEEAYEMLLKLYVKREDWPKAEKLYREAIDSYPDSYTISQLATNILQRKS